MGFLIHVLTRSHPAIPLRISHTCCQNGPSDKRVWQTYALIRDKCFQGIVLIALKSIKRRLHIQVKVSEMLLLYL